MIALNPRYIAIRRVVKIRVNFMMVITSTRVVNVG